MSTIRTLLVSATVLAIASVASAQCTGQAKTAKADGAKAGCCASKAQLASDSKGCTKAQLASDAKGCTAAEKAACAAKGLTCDEKTLASLPKMMYRVGDKTVACPMEAAKLAKGDDQGGSAPLFVVADKTYADEAEAKKAYAKALESFIAEATTVKYAVGEESVACPMTAKSLAQKEGKPLHYRLASFDFDCPEKADAAAKAARTAAEQVAMKMVVGDKEYHCAVSAAEVAKKDGKKVQFCVGDSKLTCPIDADVELARAKAIAALQAIAAAAQG